MLAFLLYLGILARSVWVAALLARSVVFSSTVQRFALSYGLYLCLYVCDCLSVTLMYCDYKRLNGSRWVLVRGYYHRGQSTERENSATPEGVRRAERFTTLLLIYGFKFKCGFGDSRQSRQSPSSCH